MRILACALLLCIAWADSSAQSPAAPTVDPVVARLVAAAQEPRIAETVRTLAAFGTRHLYSQTSSPSRGIGAAREWIRQQFIAASTRLQVSIDTYQVAAQGDRLPRDVELSNV